MRQLHLTYYVIFLSFLIACEEHTLQGILVQENQSTGSTGISISDSLGVAACYEEMYAGLPVDFDGTACHLCGSYAAKPLDTVVYYGVADFFDDDENQYTVKWSVTGSGAVIVGSDSSNYVRITFLEGFDQVRILMTSTSHAEYVCSTDVTIRNEQSAIEVDDHGEKGIVIYDKGAYTDDWSYMEASGMSYALWPEIKWGCTKSEVGASGVEIGDGRWNTVCMLSEINDETASYTLTGDNLIAASSADNFGNNGYEDWSGEKIVQHKNERAHMVTVRYF